MIYLIPARAQIYYKEIVYVFNYTIKRENSAIQKGTMYLGCLRKSWPEELGERQAAVIWTVNKKHLDKIHFSTGIYEEKDRIWLHPPRQNEFSILEYSPFPHIRFPVSNNLTWEREFEPGKYWVNKEFNIKEDDVLKFHYINTGASSYILKNKKLECWNIEAESTNLKNQTKFVGLFNSEYGFVRMEFQNIDKCIITLELNGLESWESFQKNNVSSPWVVNQTN